MERVKTMMQDIEFNFIIWKNDIIQGFIQSSYFNSSDKTISIYYHRWKDRETAFKVVILDVDHESLHAIIQEIESKEASRQYDNISTKLEGYVSKLYGEVMANWNPKYDEVLKAFKNMENIKQ